MFMHSLLHALCKQALGRTSRGLPQQIGVQVALSPMYPGLHAWQTCSRASPSQKPLLLVIWGTFPADTLVRLGGELV